MSGFAKYTSKDNFRLKERPTYRRGQGADPIKSFGARSYATSSQNADRIRDARFAKSNELNRDYAVRNKREQMLSQLYMTETDPVKLQGLHSRLKMKLSRSDGALSNAMPYAYQTKFKAQSNQPKAPNVKRDEGKHSSPLDINDPATMERLARKAKRKADRSQKTGFATPAPNRQLFPTQTPENYGIPPGTVRKGRETFETNMKKPRNKDLMRRLRQQRN